VHRVTGSHGRSLIEDVEMGESHHSECRLTAATSGETRLEGDDRPDYLTIAVSGPFRGPTNLMVSGL